MGGAQLFEQCDRALGADQLGQLQRPEWPVEAEPHRRVHVCRRADLLFEGEGGLVGDLGEEAGENLRRGRVDRSQVLGVQCRLTGSAVLLPRSLMRRNRSAGVGTVAVVVKALAALAAEAARRNELFLYLAWAPALRLVALRVEGAGDAEVDVDADQVDQLEGPHAEAAAEAADAVDRLGVGDAVGEHSQRLQREGASEPVGDEAGAVLGADRRAAHAGADLRRRLQGILRRVGGGDDLDQLHQRRRVEEVHADHASAVGNLGGDRGHGQRGGVGGEDRVGTAGLRQVREQPPLQLQVLRGRLDHEVAFAEVREVGRGTHAGAGVVGLDLAPEPLGRSLGKCSVQPTDAGVERSRNRIVQPRLVAAERGDLGDPGTHRAGADDPDPLDAPLAHPPAPSITCPRTSARVSPGRRSSPRPGPRSPSPARRAGARSRGRR